MIKIGTTIYICYKGGIYKEQVFMIGETSFIHTNAFNGMLNDDYCLPLNYCDKGKVWFTDLEMAKKHLRETTGKPRIREIEEGYWE